jgi:hypothetical protein
VVNITGNGAILNSGRVTHLFNIKRTAEDREAALIIHGPLTIKNGFATEGGAINAEAQTTLRLYDTTFSSNIARGELLCKDGAIYTKGVLFCKRCVFDNNEAYDTAGKKARPQHGGAIFCEKCNAEISDSTLSNNKAVKGGAIYIEGPSPKDPEDLVSGLKMRNSKFIDNTALRSGPFTPVVRLHSGMTLQTIRLVCTHSVLFFYKGCCRLCDGFDDNFYHMRIHAQLV